jgi:hypothetical protein
LILLSPINKNSSSRPATAANVHAYKISKSGDSEGSGGSGDTLGTKWENELAIVDLTYLSLVQILVEPLYDFTNCRTNIFFIIIEVNMIASI